jgi:hypothetical protein
MLTNACPFNLMLPQMKRTTTSQGGHMSTVTQAESKTVSMEANGSRINGSADVVDDHRIHKSRAGDEIDRSPAPHDRVMSPKRVARFAGILYLLVGIFGGFAQGYVYPKVFVAGDAANTLRNLLANFELVRIGVVSDLFQATVWVSLAMTLYVLLRQVSRSAAGAMVVFAAIGAGITMLNAVFEYEGMRVASGAVNLAAVGDASSGALAVLLIDAQHYGLLIASIFMGLWLVPLGYLAYKSGLFPKALGVVLIVGGACYIVDMLAAFLVPDLGRAIHGYDTIPSVVAEVSMLVYLLVVGVKAPKPDELIPAVA